MIESKLISFDALEVPLSGSNLIEASAGTGKTYSIAIMTLRLVVESRIPIQKILMVTFTIAAVAELEERIRLFIRQAYTCSLGEEIADATIAGVVNNAIINSTREEIREVLRDALLFLDETSVLTIHSFCQQTLTEFAFETNQLFASETLDNVTALIEREVNKYWREHVTSLQVDLLSQLMTYGLNRADLVSVINEALSGKKYFEYNEQDSYAICDEDQLNFAKQVRELHEKEEEIMGCIYAHIKKNSAPLKALTEKNRYAKEAFLHHIDNPEQFLKEVVKKIDKKYVQQLYADLIEQHSSCPELSGQKNDILQSIVKKIYCHAIGIVTKAVARHKQRNSLLSFDDMIINLHRALIIDKNATLIRALRQKYRAVFVDEFQDTDKLQYEIFHSVFNGSDNILFYIGDPKQSIYAWRKADIFTYFKASDDVGRTYSMNTNYRSSPRLIAAMNLFFKPEHGFDTFFFQGEKNSIEYIEVDAPRSSQKGELYFRGSPDYPVTVSEHSTNDAIIQTLAAQVIELLDGGHYQIRNKKQGRPVKPSDIGILVRKKDQAKKVKSALAKFGIPAVTIDESKVLESDTASQVLYLLESLIDTNRSSINKALLSPLTGYTPADLLALDEEVVLERFKGYKNTWDKDGVYSFLMKFVADYNVRAVLLSRNSESGERTITNLFQIIEILHKVQSSRQLSAAELVSWLKRGIDGMPTEGDEFEQRVESDEEAIKIVTIHMSKGLEYNIVFAPFLDLTTEQYFDPVSFRDPQTGEYIFLQKDHLDEEQAALLQLQTEQENRRLIYVAITRAVYKCYVSRSTNRRFNASSLVPFIDALKSLNSPLVQFSEATAPPENYSYPGAAAYTSPQATVPVNFSLQQLHWRKMSYTSLAAAHVTTTKNNSNDYDGGYDHFVFKQLTRGNKTGNLLHYIFESIDFSDAQYWEHTIKNAIKRFAPRQGKEFAPMLMLLLQQVMQADIEVGGHRFRLTDIGANKRLNELEFDFNVRLFSPSGFADLEEAGHRIHVRYNSDVEGILNGKMDMFFEHGGRYYVLDWKSNFLGDTLFDYRREALPEAMSENNYHLQYLLYTLAAKKFLQSRLPDFNYETQFGGVIYLFVRGIRTGTDNGIFTWKPGDETINRLEKMFKG